MRKHFLSTLARTSIGAIAIATAMPALAHEADETAMAVPAAAQTPPAAPAQTPPDAKTDKEIVVTGTQIRGATPTGQTVLTTTAEQAQEQGAVNAIEMLAQTPQAGNMFQQLPSFAGLGGETTAGLVAVSRLPFTSVSLRNLPNANTGGAPTLYLMDGFRIVPVGTDALGGQGVDVSLISSATLLRTEILPDGGSAIYGSDAVAGIINYITRDSFDGLQVQARGGVAPGDAGEDYYQYDGSVTGGVKWDTGSAFATVAYAWRDTLFGRDRDYIRSVDANPFSPLYQTPLGLNCVNPNISITTDIDPTAAVLSSRRLYPLTAPGGTIQPFTTNGGLNGSGTTGSAAGNGGGNRCDNTDNSSYFPETKTLNASFGMRQQIGDSLTFTLKAVFGRRESLTSAGLTLTTQAVPSTNVNYRRVCNAPGAGAVAPICGTTPGFQLGDHNAAHIISTNYESVLGDQAINSSVTIRSWQVVPQLAWDFADEWQVRGGVSYGKSRTFGIQASTDGTLINTRVTSGLINPYNLPASGAGAFDNIFTYAARIGAFTLLEAKVVADGPLPWISLPGGDIGVAFGGEYIRTDFDQSNTGAILSNTPSNFTFNPTSPGNVPLQYTQKVKSGFAEVQLPLLSSDNDIPMFDVVQVSGSIRYDEYNDFGNSTNYLVGVNWQPFHGVKFRGSWATAFNAPNSLIQLGTFTGAALNNSNTNAGNAPVPFFQGVTAPGGTNRTQGIGIGVALNGGTTPGIGPQTSETWSFGVEFQPSFLPGLTLNVSYYDLTISNVIAAAAQPAIQSIFDFHPELIYCAGGVNGASANAATACAIPFTSAELLAANPGYAVPRDPFTGMGGLSTPGSLTGTGAAGSGSTVSWPTIFANYCQPSVYTSGAGNGTACPAGSYTVFYIADNRQRNLGFIFAEGLDFGANYRTNVSWGSVDGRVSGTINLVTQTSAGPTSPVNDVQAFNTSTFRLSASLGTTWGGLRAQASMQHTGGFPINPTQIGTIGTAAVPGSGAYGQLRVGSYTTFDSFFRYDFDDAGTDSGLLKGLSLTFNVNNIFDQGPPIRGGGFANGLGLGRQFLFGLTKQFGGAD